MFGRITGLVDLSSSGSGSSRGASSAMGDHPPLSAPSGVGPSRRGLLSHLPRGVLALPFRWL
eukprot:14710644-Alexandrium_andersonii.AAC.1